ncbi:hypothetical protein scyTo_0012753 [Scyliorhinus torazame]|uniref:Tetratricopeptide repeat protein 1 n=1 Tax=Scyliorhinus torazame TaxID=75743 RepID=A0A401NI13_SCYTO|nr:hypothetical protein [Scyliorhinus torazame]
MDRESEDAELSEKLGTVLNVSADEREKQTVPTEHLNFESDSGELSPVKVDPSGASGNAEKPCIADGETAEDHFFECRESLGTDGFVGMEDDVVNLELEDDSETTEAKKLEFDEEYLRELEKDLPEEEKKRRQGESLTLKEVGNGQFKKGEYTEAENSYTEALGVCPAYYQKDRSILYSNRAAARMKLRLPQQIEERNEKMKEEMLGKLKDLGNMVLRPFGLSTENFLLNKDPNSGSYSINFVQNPNNNNR